MSDILVLHSVRAACQDGVTREGGSLVVRDAKYVFLDADGVALTEDRAVVDLKHGVAIMSPAGLSMVTSKYGPILS